MYLLLRDPQPVAASKGTVASTHKGTVIMALIKIPDKAMDKVDNPHLALGRQELFG